MMKAAKLKRWMKDGKEDHKLRGLIEGGAVSVDEKPDAAWLTFGAEFPGFKEEQFKRAFDRNAKSCLSKDSGTRNIQHAQHSSCSVV